MTEALINFMEPKEMIQTVKNKNTEPRVIRDIIKKMRQYEEDDVPHDYGLYENEIKEINKLLQKNFSAKVYPELWI